MANKKLPYYPNRRQEYPSWILRHIQHLQNSALYYSDSSMILYSCLEARNFLEKMEYYLIFLSIPDDEKVNAGQIAKGRYGIKALGEKYHESFYHYWHFIKAVIKISVGEDLIDYDLKISQKLREELNEYIHIYTRTQDELSFGSKFIQDAILLLDRVFALVNLPANSQNAMSFAGTSVSELKGETLSIFVNFKSGKINMDEVVSQLKALHKSEFGDEYLKPISGGNF